MANTLGFEALSQCMKEAGIAGAGGAGFPSYAKLNKSADTVILNCAECEPLLKLHRQVLALHTEEIMDALQTVARALGAPNVVIALKGAYRDALAAVNRLVPNYEGFSVCLLPEVYPAGDEVILIYEATGRVVAPGKLPITVGAVVYNVETMYNLARAMKEEAPVTWKYVTVCGEVAEPKTVKAPLGMTYGELIDLAGGAKIKDFRIIAGGPMTGRIASVNDVVTKTSNGVLVMPADHTIVTKRLTPISISMKRAMSICCNCRTCTDLCPRNLLGHPIDPQRFMQASSSGVVSDTKPYINTFFCSSCGLCELYACPQSLHPRTLITETKGLLRKNGIKIPDDVVTREVCSTREFRRVPISRLTARLGLTKYDLPAPLDETLVMPRSVKILLAQNIGAPAVSAVKVGDTVKVGDVVAAAPENALGLPVHASIDGVVTEVTDRYVRVEKRG